MEEKTRMRENLVQDFIAERLYYRIFNQKYSEDPDAIYRPKNKEKRQNYEDELKKFRKFVLEMDSETITEEEREMASFYAEL